MRKTAPVLVAALAVGAGAGLFVHAGTAREAAAPVTRPTVAVRRAHLAPPRAARVVERKATLGPAAISIPRLHLSTHVFAAAQLDRGPAWWSVTGRPGGGDTVAVAGHRTTHTHPFYYLERLAPGDAVFVSYRGKAYRYRVARTRIVSAGDLHIADAVGYERLLLTACTPRGSARYRLVVEALPA
jgi:sortase A